MLKNKVFRWEKLSRLTKRVVSPSGDGKLPIVRYEKLPSGQVVRHIVGYTDLQDRMNKEAKEVNLINMLAEVEAGTRKRVDGFSNASAMPQSKYEAKKRIENLINLWDKNPLLRLVYGSKQDLLKDFNDGVDVFSKVKKYGDGLRKSVDEVEKPVDKVAEACKQDPKVDTSKVGNENKEVK